jgi:hypothetical protein
MKEAQFIRKGRTIKNLQDNTAETFPSINAAKRKSRKLQPQLGDGTVRVER